MRVRSIGFLMSWHNGWFVVKPLRPCRPLVCACVCEMVYVKYTCIDIRVLVNCAFVTTGIQNTRWDFPHPLACLNIMGISPPPSHSFREWLIWCCSSLSSKPFVVLGFSVVPFFVSSLGNSDMLQRLSEIREMQEHLTLRHFEIDQMRINKDRWFFAWFLFT